MTSTDKAPERWAVKGWNGDHIEVEDPDGKWVLATDYDALAAENEALRAELDSMCKALHTEGDAHLKTKRDLETSGHQLDRFHATVNELDGRAETAEATLAQVMDERDHALAHNEIWQKNSRETWQAMTAMRNAINEHISMPSIESDLLQGPENSVFCAAVANAVITGLQAQRAAVQRETVERCASVADDRTPENHGAALLPAYATGKSISIAIRAIPHDLDAEAALKRVVDTAVMAVWDAAYAAKDGGNDAVLNAVHHAVAFARPTEGEQDVSQDQ